MIHNEALKNTYGVLYAGGSGSRLWPISTDTRPKQFQGLGKELSLIAQAFERLSSVVGHDRVFVSTTRMYAGAVLEAIPALDATNLVLEPSAQGKPAAYYLAAATILKRDPDAILVTTATDSYVEPISAYRETCIRAATLVRETTDLFLLLCAPATSKDESLGYIEVGKSQTGPELYFPVKRFLEKPSLRTLEKAEASSKLFWNTSHYCYSASSLVEIYRRESPEFCSSLDEFIHDMQFVAAYDGARGPKHELDAFIANGSPIGVIDGGFGWHDIGTWPSVYRMLAETTGDDRVFLGSGTDEGSRDTLVVNGSTMDIMTAGLTGLAVVASDDTVLVVPLDLLERSPEVLARLRRSADAPKRK